jgi:hypothetical protein
MDTIKALVLAAIIIAVIAFVHSWDYSEGMR